MFPLTLAVPTEGEEILPSEHIMRDVRMFAFSKDVNLLSSEDLSIFFNEVVSSGNILPVSNEAELGEAIQFNIQFFPNSAFEIRAGMTSIDIRYQHSKVYSFTNDLLPVMYFLYSQRQNKLFIDDVSANLRNLPQMDDTVFEIKCLKQFCDNGFSFSYGPSITKNGKHKRPDFVLTKDRFELFCECKQVRIGENKAELQFGKQCRYVRSAFPDGLEQQLFDKKLRLEVNFNKNPSPADLDDLVAQLHGSFGLSRGLHDFPLSRIGNSIEYLIISQQEPSPFPTKAMRFGTILLSSGKPRSLLNPETDSPTGEVLFTSTDLARRRAETLKGLVREAKSQLPDDKLGLIVIGRTNLAIAKEVTEKRMNSKPWHNIVACVVNSFETDFWSCYKTGHRELLARLFEGFQSSNPFLQAQ